MSDSAESSLSVQGSYDYKELFKLADAKNKLFLFKNEAIPFFSSSGIPEAILEEIWETVDNEQKEYITELEFYQALKLIACAQNGLPVSKDILSTRAPLPQFFGITINPNVAEIASITPNERDAYIGIFEKCNPVDGILHAKQAIEIFNKSGLPLEHLRNIWELADTRKSGTLNKTEFIIAMHYISRSRNDPHLILPTTLPSKVYSEASGRFNSSARHNHELKSPIIANNRPRASSNMSAMYTSPNISHMMASSTYSTSVKEGPKVAAISILPDEQEKYKSYFEQLDTDGSGYIDSEEAVCFFSHSQLPDSELGIIWEIADSRQLGKLDLNDFSVAMKLINMRLRGESIDKYVDSLSIQQQEQNQPLVVQTQQIYSQENLLQRYELENQLIEIKHQLSFESQRLEAVRRQQLEEAPHIATLENSILAVRVKLEKAKKNIEKAKELLLLEQARNRQLLNQSYFSVQSGFSSAELHESSTPELTRAPSIFSGTSALSPRSDTASNSVTFDPFAGFKKSEQNKSSKKTTITQSVPLSPQQSKSISKYGFDITAFDSLSVKDNEDSFNRTNIKDELASIFGSPSIEKKNTPAQTSLSSEFDSIFFNSLIN